ncbi:hypothetical protein GCM10008014_53250 [Paenibacillus silvae]|uniref:Uncharacterized protein n=1 Tax=Paenibacillus silvae TaxID=1325358 RepID=A0ABQ1ZKK1_9BACL|nr:hypothetical protein GCM10008014_53250 [Paenibacillus silvae]
MYEGVCKEEAYKKDSTKSIAPIQQNVGVHYTCVTLRRPKRRNGR